MDEILRANPEAARKIRPATILLVEDETFVREVAAEVLRGAGHRVWSAANAKEALKIHDEKHGDIDLLFSDVKLPGETGSSLAKKLRRKNPQLRVLLATGYGELMGAHPDGDECLAKPFSGAELLRRVKEMLSRGAEVAPEIGRSHFVEVSSGGLGQTFCV